ncbi:hypothetical protein, partial [Pseudomonas viridiflava]|uniref:hypothetical protein n=1 Tax=Pseudomonas viridiflava TaxID=33069 RepID=UPI0013DF55F3
MNSSTLPHGSPHAAAFASAITGLLASAATWPHTHDWAWYRVNDHLHLSGQGEPGAEWPASLSPDQLESFCERRQLQRWATGSGESVLGWLLAPQQCGT